MDVGIASVVVSLVGAFATIIVAIIGKENGKKADELKKAFISKEKRDIQYNRLNLIMLGKELVRAPEVDTEDFVNWYTAYDQYVADCVEVGFTNHCMTILKGQVDKKYNEVLEGEK